MHAERKFSERVYVGVCDSLHYCVPPISTRTPWSYLVFTVASVRMGPVLVHCIPKAAPLLTVKVQAWFSKTVLMLGKRFAEHAAQMFC